MLAEEAGELGRNRRWSSRSGPVGGGDADEEGQMRGPLGADGVNNLERQAGAIFEAAAVASVRWLASGERN